MARIPQTSFPEEKMSVSSTLDLSEISGPHARRAGQRAVVAGIVGNVLEWYDFAVYGYFAPSIGQHFFPSHDPAASLIAAFGVFAAGFLMRPLGGLVFGHIGDRFGRNHALILSVLAMAIPTFLIGVLPDHAHIGVAAPVLLVLLRMVQGVSVGGEYTTSVVYLVETASPGRRGLVASWSPFGATAGILLGSAVGSVTTGLLSQEAVDAWGWRVPFLAGLIVGLIGLAVRRHLPEPAAGRPADSGPASPVWESLRAEWRTIVQLAVLNSFLAVGFYLTFVFAVTYLEDFVHVPAAKAFDINTASMVVLLVMIPFAGALSDRVGRKPLLFAGAGGGLVLAWPLLWFMHRPDPTSILAGQMGFALLVGLFGGVIPVTMAEALPARVRCTSLSVSYNLCMGLLGGTAPMLATYLIHRSHDDLSPAFYLMATAAVSLGAVLSLRETAKSSLRPF
jgi:MHS family proline/betaine transporter-like MFS transporter